jgi:hypothetical protein
MGKRKQKKPGDQPVIVVVVTERRGFLKVLVTLLAAVVSGVAGGLVDQFWARPVPAPQVLTPAPVVMKPNTVVATASAPWESTAWESIGRATVSFVGDSITPGTDELRFGA